MAVAAAAWRDTYNGLLKQAKGGVPGAMGLLSPDVVWHQPGRTASPATTSGPMG
jgi:hypothetical protein